MTKINELDGQTTIDGFILLSEYWSDDNKREAKIYHRPFGGYKVKFYEKEKKTKVLFSNTEIDAEGHAEEFVKQIDILIQRLHKTMQEAGGIGLSANQCGVNMRMFIMGFGEQVYACINPEVIEQSDELVDEQEGCLSFPGLILRVRRPRWIQAKYTNKDGETVEERFEGLTARCYLHELDHMNGVVFTEKVGPVSLQKGRRKQQKLIKALTRKMKNEKRSNH